MVRILSLMALIVGMTSFAQQETYVRAGLISTSLTISPSTMLNRSDNNYYLTGFLQGRVDNNLSFRGETHLFTGGEKDIPYLKGGTRTFFGVQYHRPEGNFDPYIGFMPGVSVLQLNAERIGGEQEGYKLAPSASLNIGASYYVWKYFHFFVNVSYIHSTTHGFTTTSGKSDELMFSAGLGLNLNAVK